MDSFEEEYELEALGIDSKQVGPDPAGLDPMLDNNPPDDVGDMLGLGLRGTMRTPWAIFIYQH